MGKDGTLFEGRLLTVAKFKKRIPGRGNANARGNPMIAMMNMLIGGRGSRGRGGMRGMGQFRGGPRGGYRGRGRGASEG